MNPNNEGPQPTNNPTEQPSAVTPSTGSVPISVLPTVDSTTPSENTPPSSTVTPSPVPDVPNKPKKQKKSMKKIILIILAVLLFAGAVTGAFFLGKSKQKIVIKPPALQPINLPPQAVVIANCVEGRGKQYILPENIPEGPIYDVQNSKVVAIEYNLSLSKIQSDPDSLSNTILDLARKYPVDHFSLVPATTKSDQPLEDIHLIMFVVTKEESKAIKCNADATNTQ